MNKNDFIVANLDNKEDAESAVFKANRSIKSAETRGNASNYVLAIAMNRLMRAGDSQKDIVERHGIENAKLSKLLTVVRAVESEVTDPAENLGESQRAKLPEHAANLQRFFNFATGDAKVHGTYRDFASELTGDDGEARVGALRTAEEVFQGVTNVHAIATGKKLHPLDPTLDQDDDQDDDQDGGDDGGDDDESGDATDMIRNAVTVGKQQGLTVSEVMTIVNEVYKF